MRHALTVAALLALTPGWIGPASTRAQVQAPRAANWTDAVFPDRDHDFRTVARGSKVRHSFRLVNSTNQEIHIESWKTKCGCTDVRVGAREIPPGTQTVIEAVLDTTRFEGYKSSGLTLKLDRPTIAEVELNLTCFIRGDITLTPGQADFGVVNRSNGPKVDLTLAYNGSQANWAVTGMNTVSPHVSAKLTPQARSAGGPMTYQLAATLDASTPIGFFKDEITLITNDPTSPKIPISVTAVVQSNVTVSPSVINLGRVKAGDSIQKTIVVRSAQPFKVTGTTASKGDLTIAAPPDQAKATHSVTFTFKAPAQAGPYNATIEVQADLKDEPPAKVTTFATIVP